MGADSWQLCITGISPWTWSHIYQSVCLTPKLYNDYITVGGSFKSPGSYKSFLILKRLVDSQVLGTFLFCSRSESVHRKMSLTRKGILKQEILQCTRQHKMILSLVLYFFIKRSMLDTVYKYGTPSHLTLGNMKSFPMSSLLSRIKYCCWTMLCFFSSNSDGILGQGKVRPCSCLYTC